MSKTLEQLRGLVQTKLDNIGSGDDVVWQPEEIDETINEAILHIGYVGELSLIQSSLFKKTSLTVTSGFSNKPSDYFRHVYSRVDGRNAPEIDPQDIDDALYSYYKKGGSKNKYIVNYSGSQFQVFPNTSNSHELHYIAQLTELSDDNDQSPLTRVGDRYAVDWAYALCLEAKGRNPNIAIPIFRRISQILATGHAILPGGAERAVPTPVPGPSTEQ